MPLDFPHIVTRAAAGVIYSTKLAAPTFTNRIFSVKTFSLFFVLFVMLTDTGDTCGCINYNNNVALAFLRHENDMMCVKDWTEGNV